MEGEFIKLIDLKLGNLKLFLINFKKVDTFSFNLLDINKCNCNNILLQYILRLCSRRVNTSIADCTNFKAANNPK